MPLRRFKQLRSAFCFRNPATITQNELKLDAAVRIRSLLNMLKQTGSKYVDVGRNLAVDEASVAARSKFARHLIMYNPRKPTGKYHFKFYMTCCATSWIALSYRLHCASTFEQRASGVHASAATARLATEMNMTSVTRQIVLEITSEFHGSGRIVNCDNYYTSVQLLEALRLKGLFCRGTVKQSSKHFPRHVVLPEPKKADKNANKSSQKRKTHGEDSDPDDDVDDAGTNVDTQAETGSDAVPVDDDTARASGEVKRGDYLQAVCKEAKILGASWCDGNIVTIISNADTSSIDSVERLVKGKKTSVRAPSAIKEYNQNMQGVDRNDQVRARFSVADGHSFKKWYKKLGFAVVDLARVNGHLTRRLCMEDQTPERDAHRRFVAELIAEMFHGKWQDAMGDDAMLYDEGYSASATSGAASPRQSPFSQPSPSPSFASPTGFSIDCSDMSSAQGFKGQRRKRICIVCRFEGRADTTVTTTCLKHLVSLCRRTYTDEARGYGCQRSDLSCWEKYHDYYIPRGTFSATGCVVRSSMDYKAKMHEVEDEEIRSQALAQRSLHFEEAPAPSNPSEPDVGPCATQTPAAASTPGSTVSETNSRNSHAPQTPGGFSMTGSTFSETPSHDFAL